ncbi:metal ABC transporter permease [Micrococcoides hystricis]|uniref:Metal ABC transporter permease n=1 Tax=Micrococcoides hystricis TaxID=1572761 RepID=A0ABV6PDR3_9MICC
MTLVEFFTDHTFMMVSLGTAIIGLISGALGTYTYVRKQALAADVIAHSALPGTMAAFLISVLVLGIDGRTMPVLIIGALVFGGGAMWLTDFFTRVSKVNMDAAMAIVLASLFGLGLLLMNHISRGDYPGKGGIKDYLFGNAATLTRADLVTLILVAGAAGVIVALLWKEFLVQAFDPRFAQTIGLKAWFIDGAMFTTITLAVVMGTKAVGLVLMVAFLITPPVIARQFVDRLWSMMLLAGLIGAGTGMLGSYISVQLGKVPTGPIIVLLLFVEFVLALLISPRRSVLRQLQLRRKYRAEVLSK